MQPGKSTRLFFTGIVACVFAGFSSAAPVPASSTVNRTAEAASVSSPSSPTPLSPSSQSAATASPRVANTSGSSSGNSIHNSRSVHPHIVESARNSFGLALGQIDYAAAGIARRVSRIFVHKRASAHETREEEPGTESEQEDPGQEVYLKDSRDERDGNSPGSMAPHPPIPSTPPPRRARRQDADQALVDRACRWGCF